MKQRLKKLMKLAIWTSILMYLTNKFIESSATIRHLMKTSKGEFYHWRHGYIFYTVSGCGSPILLIHDLNPTSSQKEWSAVISSLSEEHTVYTIDLLGCGRSEKPNITYTTYLYVELISEFIKNIIGESTDVIATGKSGSFIIMTAKLYPELLETIHLVNPNSLDTLMQIPDTSTKISKAILSCPLLGVFAYYLLTSRNQLEYDFCEKYLYNPFHSSSKMIDTYYESAHLSRGNGRFLLASLSGNYLNFDVRFALSKIEKNINLIFGNELDEAEEIAEDYAKYNENISCSFIDKTKMLPHLEAPEKFMNVINIM